MNLSVARTFLDSNEALYWEVVCNGRDRHSLSARLSNRGVGTDGEHTGEREGAVLENNLCRLLGSGVVQVKPPLTKGSYSPHSLVMGREALDVTVWCFARVLGNGQSDVKLYTS